MSNRAGLAFQLKSRSKSMTLACFISPQTNNETPFQSASVFRLLVYLPRAGGPRLQESWLGSPRKGRPSRREATRNLYSGLSSQSLLSRLKEIKWRLRALSKKESSGFPSPLKLEIRLVLV